MYLYTYYYDPNDQEGRAGHKTQIRCPDWGAEGREIQIFEGQHNFYFLPGNIQGRFARFLHLAGCDVAQDWSLLVSGT
jgi:hypothetical protein